MSAVEALQPGQSVAGRNDTLRSFVTAARLGWQMEANWTDPLLFFIYSVAKPVAAAPQQPTRKAKPQKTQRKARAS